MPDTRSYFQVKREYDNWQGNKEKYGLGEFAQIMDRIEGTDSRHKAYHPGIATSVNAYIDAAFNLTGLPQAGRAIGEGIGEGLNAVGIGKDDLPNFLGDVTAEMPRSVAEMALWFTGPVGGGVSTVLKAARGASMASALARGTAETDSLLGGVISAATLPALPGAARAAEEFIAKRYLAQGASKKAIEMAATQSVPARAVLQTTGEKALSRYGAAQGALAATGTVSDAAMAMAGGGSIGELFGDSNYWIAQTVGQVPFLGLDYVRLQNEINTGKKNFAQYAKTREETFNRLIVDEDTIDPRNAQLDDLAMKWQQAAPKDRTKYAMEWRKLQPGGEEKYITPDLWLQSKQFRYKSPEEVIGVVKYYNDTINRLKASNMYTLQDAIMLHDDVFGPGAVTAEGLQKAFDIELKRGLDSSQATLKIAQKIENRLEVLTKQHVDPQVKTLGHMEVPGADSVQTEMVFNSEHWAGNLKTDRNSYITHQLAMAGYSPSVAQRFADITTHIDELFKDVDDTRLAVLKDYLKDTEKGAFRTLGVYVPEGSPLSADIKARENMIGILAGPMIRDNKTLDFVTRVGALSHELLHARMEGLQLLESQGQLRPVDEAELSNMRRIQEQFANLSVEDRFTLIKQLNDTLIPKEYLYKGEERNRDFSAIELQAAQNPQETMALVAQMASLGVLSPNTKGKVFKAIDFAGRQRGRPESKMLDAQKAVGIGVHASLLEHVGDLVHRTFERPTWDRAGYGYVLEKVEKSLYWLSRRDWLDENIRSNATNKNVSVDEFLLSTQNELTEYAKSHEQLPRINAASDVMKKAAIAIALRDWDDATAQLNFLKEKLKTPETWKKFAHDGIDPDGQIKFAYEFNDISDALIWMPDEVQEFLMGHFRTLQDVTSAMDNWVKGKYGYATEMTESLMSSVKPTESITEFVARNDWIKMRAERAIPAEFDGKVLANRFNVEEYNGKRYITPEYQPDPRLSPEEYASARDFVQSIDKKPMMDINFKELNKNIDALYSNYQRSLEAQTQLALLAEFNSPNHLPELNVNFLPADLIKPLSALEPNGKDPVTGLRHALGMYRNEELGIKQGFKLGAIERLFGNPAQFAQLLRKRGFNPAAHVIEYVQDIPAQIERLRTSMIMPFLTTVRGGTLVNMAGIKNPNNLPVEQRQTYNALHSILSNENAHKAFSDIARLHNERGPLLNRRMDPTSEAFKDALNQGKIPTYSKLSDDAKSNVWHMINTFIEQNKLAAQWIRVFETRKFAMMAAQRLMYENPTLSSEAAVKLMDQFRATFDYQLKSRQVREAFLQNPTELISAIAGLIQAAEPDLQMKGTFGFLERMGPALVQMMEIFDKQAEYYFTERRVGDFILKYERKVGNQEADGTYYVEEVTEGAKSKEELYRRKQEVTSLANYEPGSFQSYNKKEFGVNEIPVGSDAIMNALLKQEQAYYEDALATLGKDEADRLRALYSPLSKQMAELKKKKLASYLKPRQLKAGRESIDMFEAGIEYYNALAYKLSNDYARALTDVHMLDPVMRDHQELAGEIANWADNLTTAKSREYHELKNGIFSYYLGWNPSSMIIEGLQSFITTVPMIVEEMGTIRGAHKLLGKAARTLGEAYFNSGKGKGMSFKDPVLQENFQRAINERILEYGSIEELSKPEEIMNVNAMRLKDGQEPWTAKDLLVKPLHFYSKFGRTLYSVVSGANAKLSYIIGHDMAMQKGLSKGEAHNYAKNFVRRSTHSGGEYNRAIGFYRFGKVQSSASVLYTLNNFTFATLHMASRLMKDSIDASNQLTPAQKTQARKAFGTMMGAQFVLAGAFGMPLAGAALALAEQITGETIRGDIRSALAAMSGDDELGEAFADVATRGFSTLLGIDAQSRFGLGSILGFSEYQGFDATGFAGAAGGIVENMYQGLRYASRGEPIAALREAVPQALKRPIELWNSKGKYLDAKGELLIDPTTAEQFAYLIGFRPKRFSDVRLMQRVGRSMDDLANRERRRALEEIAQYVDQKPASRIREELMKLQKDNPLFQYDDPDDLVNRLVDIVLEQRIPLDPMRSGSYASLPDREQFSKSMPTVRRNMITEQQRQLLKSKVKQSITGKVDYPSRQTMSEAQMIDQYIAANPAQSYQAARAALGLR